MALHIIAKPFHLALLTFECEKQILGLYDFLTLFWLCIYEQQQEGFFFSF